SGSRGTSGASAPTSSTASRRCRSPSRSPEACLWRGRLGGRRATGGGRGFRRRSGRAPGDRRPGPVAVAPAGYAPVVAAARGGGASGAGQLVLQETVGQVQLPLCWMVTPQLLPLPLGVAVSTWALGQVALMFQVAMIFAGDGTFIVTVQLFEPDTATLRF